MNRLRAITLAFAGVVGLAVGASSASAATFCVHAPAGCVGRVASVHFTVS
jgi:hypothetical protein